MREARAWWRCRGDEENVLENRAHYCVLLIVVRPFRLAAQLPHAPRARQTALADRIRTDTVPALPHPPRRSSHSGSPLPPLPSRLPPPSSRFLPLPRHHRRRSQTGAPQHLSSHHRDHVCAAPLSRWVPQPRCPSQQLQPCSPHWSPQSHRWASLVRLIVRARQTPQPLPRRESLERVLFRCLCSSMPVCLATPQATRSTQSLP